MGQTHSQERSHGSCPFSYQFAHSGSSTPASSPNRLTRNKRSLDMTLDVRVFVTRQNALGTPAAASVALASINILDPQVPTALRRPDVLTATGFSPLQRARLLPC